MGLKVIQSSMLEECECAFFRALPPDIQEINRQFRLATKEGKDIPNLYNSMCGECVRERRIETLLNPQVIK